jgi:hypothetical protein
MHLAGHMWPAGHVFETPAIKCLRPKLAFLDSILLVQIRDTFCRHFILASGGIFGLVYLSLLSLFPLSTRLSR